MGILEQLAEIKAAEALEIGMEKGMEKGEEKATRLFIENLLKESNFPLEKIASLCGQKLSYVMKIKGDLGIG